MNLILQPSTLIFFNLWKNVHICILLNSFSLPAVGKKISLYNENCVRDMHFYVKVYIVTQQI